MTPTRAAARETIKFRVVKMGLHNLFLVFEEMTMNRGNKV